MAYSSSYPALTAHQHSATAGDGGVLDANVTIAGGITLASDSRGRAMQMTYGPFDVSVGEMFAILIAVT